MSKLAGLNCKKHCQVSELVGLWKIPSGTQTVENTVKCHSWWDSDCYKRCHVSQVVGLRLLQTLSCVTASETQTVTNTVMCHSWPHSFLQPLPRRLQGTKSQGSRPCSCDFQFQTSILKTQDQKQNFKKNAVCLSFMRYLSVRPVTLLRFRSRLKLKCIKTKSCQYRYCP